MKVCCILAGIALLLLSTAKADSTQLGAHVHGLSELTIAIEDQLLEIQLTSPAMDLVGFEHQASTEQDIATVKRVLAQLRKQDGLFLFSAGRCILKYSSATASNLNEHKHKLSDHAHDHSNHSAHSHHDYHESHSEIVANYRYHCADMAALSSLRVALFKHFPGIHQIRVMWISQTQQGFATLTSGDHTVSFKSE